MFSNSYKSVAQQLKIYSYSEFKLHKDNYLKNFIYKVLSLFLEYLTNL